MKSPDYRTFIVTLALAGCFVAGGCSSRQLYGAGQSWQSNECRKLPPQEQERCRQSTAMTFEEYRRQAEAARSTK